MEGLSADTRQAFRIIQGIAQKRMADVRHVHADLVSAPGLQMELRQG